MDETYIIGQLLFAYVNKHEDYPHYFEVQAVDRAVEHLKEHSDINNDWLDAVREDFELKHNHGGVT